MVIVREEERTPGCWDTVAQLLKVCGMCCYFSCPPVPECVARKLAFHPPKKGILYSLQLKDGTTVKNAAEVHEKEFGISLPMHDHASPLDYQLVLETIYPTVVRSGSRYLTVMCAKPRNPSDDTRVEQQVILMAQPNSSDLGAFLQPMMLNFSTMADCLQCLVYAFDYSGYGYSTGAPSETNVYQDVRAVYEHIRLKHADKKIVFLGYSLGTAVMIDLASSQPEHLAGMILIAPFTSGLRLLSQTVDKEKSSVLDRFKSYDKIPNVEVPILFCHGAMDTVIPMSHSLALFERSKFPVVPLILHGADHQTIFSGSYPQTLMRMLRFLRRETVLTEEEHSALSPNVQL